MKKNNFFIYAPSNSITGGQECLHQLCGSLNDLGQNASMIYYPNNKSDIPLPYLKYNVKKAEIAPDELGNIIILHESQFDRNFNFNNSQVIHWWLSVDNFFKSSMRYLSLKDYYIHFPKLLFKAILVKIYYIFFRRNNVFSKSISISDLRELNTINLCQSKYAHKFLENNKFNNLMFLNDYINSEFFCNDQKHRHNRILYNPKKGYKFLKKLKKQFPQFEWVPIINMKYEEIALLMRTSKLYVDFGNHPGRDKIPREAVIAGMCVLTGTQGSAFYYEDIPISNDFKFDEYNFDKSRFENTVNNIFNDFNNENKKFEIYRKLVITSENDFNIQVGNFLLRLKSLI